MYMGESCGLAHKFIYKQMIRARIVLDSLQSTLFDRCLQHNAIIESIYNVIVCAL